VDLSVSSLLASHTVANMTAMVIQRQAEMTKPDGLAEDLAELPKLSEEEVQRLVGQVIAKCKV